MKYMIIIMIFICATLLAEETELEAFREKYARVLNENVLLKQKLEKFEKDPVDAEVPTALSLRDVVDAWKKRKALKSSNSIQKSRFVKKVSQRFVGDKFKFDNAVVLDVKSCNAKMNVTATRADGFSKTMKFHNLVRADVLLPVTKYPRISKEFIEKGAGVRVQHKDVDYGLPHVVQISMCVSGEGKQLFESLSPGDVLCGHGVVARIAIKVARSYSKTRYEIKNTSAKYGFDLHKGTRVLMRQAKNERIVKNLKWDNPVIATMILCDCVVYKR